MDNDIIRIAEAMGWIRTKGHTENPMSGRRPFETWSQRGGKVYDYLPFSPKTSHADCHALIEWLNERKIFVEVSYFVDGQCWVQIEGPNHRHRDRYEGLDYRLGVVELTLKLLEKEDG